MGARASIFLTICALVTQLVSSPVVAQRMFRSTTTNFEIHAPDPQFARKIGTLAEKYRKDLSEQWLGYEIKTWKERCPIHVQIARHAGGETSFAFVDPRSGTAEPISWQMKIFGPPDRILDAVLPHEITHTIFATHFGRPLPRWADEGACTTVEHETEREKNHQMLIDFLTTKPSRGIPFNRMFTMREYPHDILPLYAQGYSLAKFLIMQKGRRHFIDYIGAGLNEEVRGAETKTWDQVTDRFYGYENLSELQVSWIEWVRNGSPEIERKETTQIAAKETPPTSIAVGAPSANETSPFATGSATVNPTAKSNYGFPTILTRSLVAAPIADLKFLPPNPSRIARNVTRQPMNNSIQESWYAKQARSGKHTIGPSNSSPRATHTSLLPGNARPNRREHLSRQIPMSSSETHSNTIWR